MDKRPVGHSRESETKPTHTQKLINGRGSHRDQGGKEGFFFFAKKKLVQRLIPWKINANLPHNAHPNQF